jgi:short-subunit dehydrogenase
MVAAMRLIHLLSPKMAERGFGRIINVSSSTARSARMPDLGLGSHEL